MAKKITSGASNKTALLALVISFFSLLLNFYFSHESNNIAKHAQDIAQDNNNFEKISRSQTLVDNNYDLLYDNGTNQKIMQAMKHSQNIGEQFTEDEISSFVDVFEGVGSYYCQGDVYKRSLVNSFYNSLKYYCRDEYIYQNYKGQKNGSAALCAEFFPESKFASTLDRANLDSCTFHDGETDERFRR